VNAGKGMKKAKNTARDIFKRRSMRELLCCLRVEVNFGTQKSRNPPNVDFAKRLVVDGLQNVSNQKMGSDF
jgi:hypothetical protein